MGTWSEHYRNMLGGRPVTAKVARELLLDSRTASSPDMGRRSEQAFLDALRLLIVASGDTIDQDGETLVSNRVNELHLNSVEDILVALRLD